MTQQIHWSKLALTYADGELVNSAADRRAALEEFREHRAIDGYFFEPIGADHEDADDASTWGPANPDSVDWTGFE